jgi:hypothetical protein
MCGEQQGRLAIRPQGLEAYGDLGRYLDSAGRRVCLVEVPDPLQVDIFGGGAAEVIPGFPRDPLMLGRRQFGECVADVVERDAVRLHQRPEAPRDGRPQPARPVRTERPHQREQHAHQRRDGRIHPAPHHA